MPVDDVHKLISAIDNKKTEFNSPPFISKKLRDLVGIPEPIELQQQIDDKLKQAKDELQNKLKQSKDELQQQIEQTTNELMQANYELKQQMKNMQDLLNSFIKNSNANN